MLSANRTFWWGKIESFCINWSVLTATVVSKSSPSNEMLKEKLMAQAENDKEKKIKISGCKGHSCALRAGTHKTAKWTDSTLFPLGVGQQSIWQSDQTAVFLHSIPSKIWTIIVHAEQQCGKFTKLYYSGRKSPAEERHLLWVCKEFPVQEVWDAGLNLQQSFSQQSTAQRVINLHRCFFCSIRNVQTPFMEHQQFFGVCPMSFLCSFLNITATKLFRKIVYIHARKEISVPILSFPWSFSTANNCKAIRILI